MRLIRDMRVGESGYCVSWAIGENEINGELIVGPYAINTRYTRIFRHGSTTFSARLWHDKHDTYLKLKGAVETCIFPQGGEA